MFGKPLTRLVCTDCSKQFDNTDDGMKRYKEHRAATGHTGGYEIVDIE